ncbi:MAG: hypothetical protein HND59_06000 [Pseudomonadota bacterium]|nr:MAG: hypothetical protein HND59_06000 [Pseudomonadota bacterium]
MDIKPLIQNRNLRIAGKGVLPALGLFTLFLACTALVLKSFGILLPAASLHLFLGLGVLPLILGAMAHFIPVLTRTAPRAGDQRPALLGLAAGLLAISGQQFWFPLIYPAAALGMAAGIDLLLIAQRRARDCIGAPHPCLRWYQAALACLVLALAALLLSAIFPRHWTSLRQLHLHLNLLGFVGITAVGTLQVLLPTVAGFTDPASPARLQRDIKWVIGGTLIAALGAIAWGPLGLLGIVLWLIPVLRLILSLRSRLGHLLSWHGAGVTLTGALLGLTATLALTIWHGVMPGTGRSLLIAMLGLFLLPLITGALTQLLPVWLRPERDDRQRQLWQRRIGWGAAYRLTLFWTGAGLHLAGYTVGAPLIAAVAALFVAQTALTLLRPVP